jgi:hypothetical protein
LHAIPPFIDLLKSKPLEAQHDVAMTLHHLSSLQINKMKLIQASGVAILPGVVEGDSSILALIPPSPCPNWLLLLKVTMPFMKLMV